VVLIREVEVDDKKVDRAAANEDVVVVFSDVGKGAGARFSDCNRSLATRFLLYVSICHDRTLTADVDNEMGECRHSHDTTSNRHGQDFGAV
jgi:hypothetical protein